MRTRGEVHGNGQRGWKFLNSQHRHRASSVPMWLMAAADLNRFTAVLTPERG